MNEINKAASTKVSATKQKKQAIVTEVTAKVQKAKGFVFTNYQGLTHLQLEGLKRGMKKLEAEYVATKNTLLLRSLKEQNITVEDTSHLQGPTATLFLYNDLIEPIKELAKTIKALNLPIIKFGIIQGNTISAQEVEKLSTLPPVNVLRAQLLGQIKSPISGFHRALNWNLQKLVLTLNAVQNKKATSQQPVATS